MVYGGGFSSIGFLLMTMSVGFMIAGVRITLFGETFGFDGFLTIRTAVFGTFIVLMTVSFLLSFFLPGIPDDEKEAISVKKEKKAFNREDIKALLMNKPFRFILVFIV